MISAALFAEILLSGIAYAAEAPPLMAKQNAGAVVTDVPDFQRHVLPLLGRLGCNGRACHGSFQGQGGFRLSLFGYDFAADHKALTQALGNEGTKRVDLVHPPGSLILRKPTSEDEHGGGRRMQIGSRAYQLLQRWIESGAKTVTQEHRLERLELLPAEFVFAEPGQTRPLKVIVHWADGTSEDVTWISRFQSNDESLAAIDADGKVTSVGKGGTYVVAFYDNGVAAVPVITPISDRVGPNYPAVPTPSKVDELVVAKLRKLGITPSPQIGDAQFLRRVSLDVTGTLPSAETVESFLADTAPNKRSRKIDELLDSPEYSAWWATKLCDTLGTNDRRVGTYNLVRHDYARLWYEWVAARIAENTPYDRLIERMVVADGRRPGQSYLDYCREMSSYVRREAPADHADRPTVPYYWERRYIARPEDNAIGFAHAFLGLRIQCAQCHKHPFDQWTRPDFQHFSAFFAKLSYGYADGDSVQEAKRMTKDLEIDKPGPETQKRVEAALAAGRPLPFREVHLNHRLVYRPRDDAGIISGEVVPAKLIGSNETVDDENLDPRQVLMDWMRRRDNPYFARAFVSRVWAGYFGVGIVDPPDDQNQANPPSNRELLDYLVDGFMESKFDMKWLHRQIANSRTYQLSWETNETNRFDGRHFSRAIIRRLPAEVAYDAVRRAVAVAPPPLVTELKVVPGSRLPFSTGRLDGRQRAIASLSDGDDDDPQSTYFLDIFGKPDRLQTCDCERSNETTLMQFVYLHNDEELLRLVEESPWVDLAVGATNLDSSIRQAYLRSLSRPPTDHELERARRHLTQARTTKEGLQDLLWVLLNTKEFLTNH